MELKVSISMLTFIETVPNRSSTHRSLRQDSEPAATGQEAACNAITTCVTDQLNVPLHTKSECC